MSEARLLEPGMVLLDPETYGRPHVWTVTRVAQKSATIIAHYVSCTAEGKLRTPRLPNGWMVVEHDALAALLAERYLSQRSNDAPSPGVSTPSEQREHSDG